ncbi:amidohydrolase family protein [Acidipila sp. EB88]|uniref:amidohydrolase family protein n=1 Tax=Acidipila sp. EB88 TaxID=2305226 RepID=UPI001F17B61D|nr:amidohydrolase family protein [Acidipila sp. EB88]
MAAFLVQTAPVVAFTHVTVINGQGGPAQHDQTVVLRNGVIAQVESSSRIHPPDDAAVIDASGKTLLPGLIGMHEHMFYPAAGNEPDRNALYAELADSAPRLYLAAGITTARTAGSIEPFADLALKQAIDAGRQAGPALDVTGPYLEGKPTIGIQLHELTGPDDASALVNYWGDRGATSFKAYMHITPAELAAAIAAAHKRGDKITGHLCSIGFTEAAEMGIDNLEHGLLVDTEFYSKKQPGVCPGQGGPMSEMAASLDITSAPVQRMIQTLVEHHVAVTSTLAIFESFVPDKPPLDNMEPVHTALSGLSWDDYATRRGMIAQHAAASHWSVLLSKEMQFERAFAKAGGLLMAGCDPTGYGGVLAGYGDQRAFELLVAAGFTPAEAVAIYTSHAAQYLGRSSEIGTIAPGMQADLVLLDGDLEHDASVIRKPELVFKKGVGYSSARLQQSVKGIAGQR